MLLGDRYELLEPLASCGMAQVWSAIDKVLDRSVAAKILHPHLATDEAFVERFRREAVAAARLSHSSIAAIYDTISAAPMEAIVMELIDGRTLRRELDDVGALSTAEVVRIGARIADALDEAHRGGIVHRDIKPANIMLAADQRVLVTDFGIAKAGSDADLTVTGTLLGTAKYLAPEQVSGDPVDPRADLYSLGVVLFEALTGTVPFRANTDAATALARLHQDPPPVRQLRPNVSAELEAVVARLMARNPADRYHRASLARDALLAADSGESRHGYGPAPVPGPDRRDDVLPSAFSSGRPATAAGPAIPSSAGHGGAMAPPGAGGYAGGRPIDTPSPPPQPPRSPIKRAAAPAPAPAAVEMLDLDLLGDRSEPPPAERVVRSKRSRLVPILGIAVVVVAAVTVGSAVTDVGVDDMLDSVMGAEPAPLSITGVRSFDPQSPDETKEEQEELTQFAVDNDLSTAWKTERYRQRQLSGLKDGVGLQLQLSETRPLTEIDLRTNSEDWAADIYVADQFSDDGSDWGEPIVSIQAGSNRVVRELSGASGAIVLLWIRDTGVTGETFQFELAEVVVR
jgi:serine/threonine-protein kinase